MKNRTVLQGYINDFRRHLAHYLKPSVGVECAVFPAGEPGALLEFIVGPEVSNEDHFNEPMPTVNDALKFVQQQAFGGTLGAFRFEGTNIVVEGNRIIIIKGGDSPSLWSDKAARDDVRRIVHRPPRPRDED